MLKFLEIRDFALIDHLSLQFREGLNLLTGETGSGKSIIVDALGLLAGAKARSEMVRTGSGKATVSACFEGVERLRGPLEASGLEFDSEGVIVRREVVPDGRGRAFVNNQMVPVSFLRKLRSLLRRHSRAERPTVPFQSRFPVAMARSLRRPSGPPG